MKKALSFITAFLAVSTSCGTAVAADTYVSANVGMSSMNDIKAEWFVNKNETNTISTDTGYALSAAVGRDYGDYRFEWELGYSSQEATECVTDANISPLYPMNKGAREIDGDINVLSFMVNGYYDIDLGGIELSPFVGVGYAKFEVDGCVPESNTSGNALHTSVGTFAYQLGVAVSVPVSSRVKVDARYRYFATDDFQMYMPNADVPAGVSPLDHGSYFNWSGESHSAMVGLRVTI